MTRAIAQLRICDAYGNRKAIRPLDRDFFEIGSRAEQRFENTATDDDHPGGRVRFGDRNAAPHSGTQSEHAKSDGADCFHGSKR